MTDGLPRTWVTELGPTPAGVSVRATDARLLRTIAELFGAPRPRPAAGLPEGDAVFLERDPDGGEIAVRALGVEHRAADLAHAVARLDDAVDEVIGERQRDFLLLHASAVLDPERGALVFLGPSGAGKSTTATLLALAGLPFLGDECLALTRAPRPAVLRWRRPLALRADVLQWVDAAAERTAPLRRTATDYKTYGYTADLPVRTRRRRVPVAAFFRLDADADADGPEDPGAVFREACAACHYFQRGGAETFRELARIVQSAPTFRLRPHRGHDVIERVPALLR